MSRLSEKNKVFIDIINYENKYQISNYGDVVSLDFKNTKQTKLLKIRDNRGYKYVELCSQGKKRKFYIHRLVAIHFVDNPKNLSEVNHKDENKGNNYYTNLEWCTNKYNHNYGSGHDRTVKNTDYSKRSNKFNKPVLQYDLNNNLIKEFKSMSLASKETKISLSSISNCCNGKISSSAGYIWKFKNVNNKKFFITSDEHGHFYELKKALEENGFDYDNENHIWISLSDCFDRGEESLELYLFIRDMEKKNKCIILNGNHFPFFLEWLQGPVSAFNFINNGLDKTIDSFDERTKSFYSWILIDKGLKIEDINNNLWYEWSQETRDNINKKYPDLIEWLSNRPDYIEMNNYILTHSSIQEYGDWKNPYNGWNYHHWDDGSFITKNHQNTDKTIVLGHFSTAHLREMWQIDSKDGNDHSILKFGNNIFIDTCTILTKKVNVLIIDDEEILDNLQNKKEVK